MRYCKIHLQIGVRIEAEEFLTGRRLSIQLELISSLHLTPAPCQYRRSNNRHLYRHAERILKGTGLRAIGSSVLDLTKSKRKARFLVATVIEIMRKNAYLTIMPFHNAPTSFRRTLKCTVPDLTSAVNSSCSEVMTTSLPRLNSVAVTFV